MTADIVQAQYESLQTIATKFGQAAENNAEMQQRIRQGLESLQNGGWVGKGAEAFFGEMERDVLPATQRLSHALEQAQTVTLQIEAIIREAEEEAARVFGGSEQVDRSPNDAPSWLDRLLGNDIRIDGFDSVENGKLFIQGTKDAGPIDSNDVGQGSIGDCYLISSLAAVANGNPDLLRNAIRDNGDGTYTVTFYEKQGGFMGIGDEYKPVEITVTPEFPEAAKYSKDDGRWANISFHADDSDMAWDPANRSLQREIWPLLYEKAYGQYLADGDATDGYFKLDDGGHSHNALEAISGIDSEDHSPDHYDIDELADMHKNGYAITLSSEAKYLWNEDKYIYDNNYKLVRGHAYWVESVDQNAGTITVRNPWGYSDSIENKIIIKWSDLDDNFRQISINPLKE